MGPAVLVSAIGNNHDGLPRQACASTQLDGGQYGIVKSGASAKLRLLNCGLDLLKIGCKVRGNLNLVVERYVEEFAACMRRADQSLSRLLRPIDLVVVLHAVAVVEQDAECDRLLRVRKEFDLLSDAVIENGKVLRFQTPHITPARVRH